MQEFKYIITNLRKHRGWNQKELAENLGVSASTVGMWECGDRLPSHKIYVKIAKLFCVDINYLFDWQDIDNNLLPGEKEVAEKFARLDDIGKKKLVEYLNDLLLLYNRKK